MSKSTCSIEVCIKPVHCQDLCSAHYRRLKVHGDPLAGGPEKRRNPGSKCEVDQCAKVSRSRGLCETHYMRVVRTGEAGTADLLAVKYFEGMTEKRCTTCKEIKPIGSFHKVNRPSKYVAVCKSCRNTQISIYQRKRLYGLDEAEYRQMVDAQGGMCAICESTKRICIDHDHSTGAVRKLLCDMCNKALGLAEDNPSRLRAMADYLEAH